MEGQHSGVRAGRGWEFLDLAEYRPGDDVHDIDWAATAKTGDPIVRRFESTANLGIVLVVDTGRSMGALAPSGETKAEVALAACEAIAWLGVARGDRVGAVAGDAERLTTSPARTGKAHAETLLRRIRQEISLDSPRSDVARLLDRALVATRRRSLLVLVTDSAQPEPGSRSERLLKRLLAQHRAIVVSVDDMAPTDLPPGTRVVDVDEGPLPDFLLTDARLAAEARAVADERRARVSALLERPGLIPVRVASSEEVPRALLAALERGSRVR